MFNSTQSKTKKPVRLAFLQFLEPSLGDVLNDLADHGIRRIVIFPLFIAGGGHVDRDIPEIVSSFPSENRGVEITIMPALGEHADFQELVGDLGVAALENETGRPEAP